MSYLNTYKFWKTDEFFDEQTRKELENIKDKKEIEDRFYKNLDFGTAGLRGVMGAGTNRMNKYVVGKATLGFARYLIETFGEKGCQKRGVAIGYDTRNNSEYFAKITADVFSAEGIKVYLHKNARPISELSYTIQQFKTVGGVVITASHNTSEYNGYKVYNENGCQLVPSEAKKVTASVESIEDYKQINFTRNVKLVKEIDITDKFVAELSKQSRISNKTTKADLCVVYTPIHGSGLVPVTKLLKKDGFSNVFIVKDQERPNGDFPTVSAPNPENRQALELGIKQAENINADIVVGTDPDCDRVGAAVKTSDGYKLITGNQMGALLTDFIISQTNLSKWKKPALIKSIVSSEFAFDIARKHGIKTITTLTGFKFIGDKIIGFENAKKEHNSKNDYDFLFGFEESYGYLIGTHAKDKDAVVATMMICEMAALYKAQGKTLIDRLNELYAEYGYYLDTQESFTLKGKEGLEQIASIMVALRTSKSPFADTANVADFKKEDRGDAELNSLPFADVVMYYLTDGSWIAVRPSGTEPKLKIYYSLKAENEDAANKRLEKIQKTIKTKMKL